METNANNFPAATNRREFIKKSATVAAAVASTNIFKTPVYGQNQAPSTGRVIGANDRISVAVIGVGEGIGKNHLEGIHKSAADNNTIVVAAADLFDKRRAWAVEHAGLKDSDVVAEYKKVLERKDVDAVVVATHDVWHSTVAIDALNAGKHVYSEKPLSRYLQEAYDVEAAVKSTGKVFQVGSQGCSAGTWLKCAELVRDGKIGTLVWAQGYYCRNSIGGEWNSPPFNIDKDSNAKSIDWETWQGKVHNKRDFSADYFHRWRKYYPYCAGILGDLAPHRLHPIMLATGNPEFPVRVSSIGTRNIHADKNTPDTVERDVPEHQQLIAEFPSGFLLTLTIGTVNAKSPGAVMYGHKATLNVGDTRVDLVPEREFSEEIDPANFDGLQQENIRAHEKNWFDCIRSGKPTNGNIDLAVRVQTVLSMGEMSERLRVTCLFDEKTRTISTADGKKLDAITYGTLPLS